MSRLLELIKVEIFKLFRLPAYWYAAGMCLFGVIVVNLFPLIDSAFYNWADTIADAMAAGLFFTNVAMLVVAALFFGSEYQNRTVQLTVSLGVSRLTFLAAKFVALVVGAYVLFWILSFATGALSIAVGFYLGGINFGHINMWYAALTLAVSPLTVLTYLFVSSFFTILFRSGTFPIIMLILYSTLGELFVAAVMGADSKYLHFLPGRVAGPIDAITIYRISEVSLDRILQSMAQLSSTTVSAFLGILAYVILFGGLSYAIFRDQDLSR